MRGILPGILSQKVGLTLPVLESHTWGSTFSVQASTVTVNKPSGVQVGDLLLVVTQKDAGHADPVGLAGWIRHRFDPILNNLTTTVFYRIADGTEGVNFTFNLNSAGGRNDAMCCRISGANTVAPIHAETYNIDATDGVTYTPSYLVTSVDKCLGLHFLCVYTGGSGTSFQDTSAPSAGWTEFIDERPANFNAYTASQKPELINGANERCVTTRTQISGTQRARMYQFAIAPGGS